MSHDIYVMSFRIRFSRTFPAVSEQVSDFLGGPGAVIDDQGMHEREALHARVSQSDLRTIENWTNLLQDKVKALTGKPLSWSEESAFFLSKRVSGATLYDLDQLVKGLDPVCYADVFLPCSFPTILRVPHPFCPGESLSIGSSEAYREELSKAGGVIAKHDMSAILRLHPDDAPLEGPLCEFKFIVDAHALLTDLCGISMKQGVPMHLNPDL